MSSIRNSIPWCFAYDNINYARYLSSYLSKTSHLKEQQPRCSYLFEAWWLCCINWRRQPLLEDSCWSIVWGDCKQGHTTPWRYQRFKLETKGSQQVLFQLLSTEVFMRTLKDMLNLSKSSSQHIWSSGDMRPIYSHCYIYTRGLVESVSCKKYFPIHWVQLPWSLAATDDSLKNTLKTSLAKESAVHGSV